MTFDLAAELAAEFRESSATADELYRLISDEQMSTARAISPELRHLAARVASRSTLSRAQFAAACSGALAAIKGDDAPKGPLLLVSPADWIPAEVIGVVSDIQHALVEMIASATELVTLMAPFGTAHAITAAVQPLSALDKSAGTRLRLMTAGPASHVDALINQLRQILPAGLRERTTIFAAPPEGMWPHAKLLLIDDRTGYLGSANFTSGGLDRYFELGTVLTPRQAELLHRLVVPRLLAEVFTLRRELKTP